ncbi:MAG: hypothetical protein ACYS1A_04605 [Planctomycetota bacterium]|jgi:hypothetical protein
MKNLTDTAQNRLDKYLSRARASLHTCTGVDADEVESDIRAHIETELEGTDEPVSLKNLEAVLDRLGSPTQWVPEEEISWWRKIILRLRTGPEDWRLAYISFALFVLAFLIGRQAFFVLLLASFCISRATLLMTPNPEQLGGQKWLIYPSLLVLYIPLLIMLLILPIIPVVIMAETQTQTLSNHSSNLGLIPNYYPGSQFYTFWISVGFAVVGLWWIILGILGCAGSTLLKVIFRPFADNFKRRWAGLLLGIGILLIIVCLGAGLFFMSRGYFTHRAFLR